MKKMHIEPEVQREISADRIEAMKQHQAIESGGGGVIPSELDTLSRAVRSGEMYHKLGKCEARKLRASAPVPR
jgi:hypothetical protein